MRKYLSLILILTLLCHLLSGCSLLFYGERSESSEDKEYIAKLEEVIELLDELYVDGYDKEDLADYLASAAVAAAGDRWSYYVSADEMASYEASRENEYVGIGVSVQTTYENDSGLSILEVNPNGPAYKAGLMPRDMIVAVEGKAASEIGVENMSNMIGGEEGTDVTLTILRGTERFDVTITRAQIETIVVSYELLGTTGYIKIANFHARCAQESIAAIEELQTQGATSLIFDLRYNPGGSLDELITILDYLLPEGVIFRSVNYKGKEEIMESDAENYLEIPMCVLVNEDSYSAAEFFAAALQEYDYATVVGTQTVGKGNYQQTFMLSDGSAVAISTGHYSTPNGVNLEGVGITPDIISEVDEQTYIDIYLNAVEKADDPQLQAALKALQE